MKKDLHVLDRNMQTVKMCLNVLQSINVVAWKIVCVT